jgi:hypothetical protein
VLLGRAAPVAPSAQRTLQRQPSAEGNMTAIERSAGPAIDWVTGRPAKTERS